MFCLTQQFYKKVWIWIYHFNNCHFCPRCLPLSCCFYTLVLFTNFDVRARLSLAESSRSISIGSPIVNIRTSDGRWIDFSNACRNVPPVWTETSYSYSVCCDVNTHTGTERCVMHVGIFETYKYKRTGQIFVWNYIGNWYVFSKYLDNYCRYQYCANDTLFWSISCILRSIFQDFFAKKDDVFCETTDTAHSYIKQIVKFSEIKVSIDAWNGLTKNCFRILVLCKGTE